MKNVILIGMPGCGKSTAGVILAKSLGFDFTDTDLIISKKCGKKLQAVLDEDGIDYFLQMENKVGCELECRNTVVATGGSMVLSTDAMEHLKEIGTVVYIDVPLDVLKKRITNMKTRGIVFEKGESLDDVFKKRTPLYKKYADITVTVAKNGNLENTVTRIADFLHRKPQAK